MSLYWLFRRRQWGKAIIIMGYLFSPALFAQEIQVKGGFLSDSIKIGEETAFYLSARYPGTQTILFPDSSNSFSSFDYHHKKYFLTETTGGISADSAVYYLTTFEVDRIQYLDLPVYVVNSSDCTIVRTLQDSILITQLVLQVPDSLSAEKLPLKMNTTYQKVFLDFNFWVLVIALFAVTLVSMLIWVFFGKKIKKYFMARKMEKRHTQFIQNYNSFLTQLHTAFSTLTTESALFLWKKYMEQLESKPYTKLTTRETLTVVKDPALSEHLRRIDQAIYGHNTSVIDALQNLKSFANQQFIRKIEEVKHG